MSDYTPTTKDVKACYLLREIRDLKARGRYEPGDEWVLAAEFDRWLEGVRAEARAEGALWAMNNGYAGTRITDINHTNGSES